ncbi:MAG: tRNA 5-hydroxyuridine modification protein YegQ [Magnetococcales bacterium]|nr:tRNA 5-hydroxyuridine modification protein YegQ [Magnetococcales bacterium]
MNSKRPHRPELLAPAGTLKSLRYAVAYGADAVYVGVPRYSLRVRENEFDLPALERATAHIRAHNRKLYIACNIAPHNRKVDTFLEDVAPMVALGPDALILSDPGVIHLVRHHWPDMPIHLSVQANVVNYAAVEFWRQVGVSRIILSRELSLDEVEEIAQHGDGATELEVFIHGALCVAYSGRCLLSGYMNHRDANQGACTNACRWEYRLHEATQTETGDIVPKQDPATVAPPAKPVVASNPGLFLLEERQRPGELMPIFEDDHGTYILNSKDLRAIRHINRFISMGIHALKIEGRTKSHFYVARTTQVYRAALNAALRGEPLLPEWLSDLESLAHRGYTEGFYQRHTADALQNYQAGRTENHQQFVGEVIDQNEQSGTMTVAVKNRFEVGNELELMTPEGNCRFRLQHMESELGEKRLEAPGSGYTVVMPLPREGSAAFGLLIRRL